MADQQQANKETLKRFLLAVAKGDVEGVKAEITDDMRLMTMGTSVISANRNRAELLDVVGFLSAVIVPGMELRFISTTAEEDRVSCEMEGYGKLVNGSPYENIYHLLARFRDGKLCQLKEYIDTKYTDSTLGVLLQQNG